MLQECVNCLAWPATLDWSVFYGAWAGVDTVKLVARIGTGGYETRFLGAEWVLVIRVGEGTVIDHDVFCKIDEETLEDLSEEP